MIAYIDESGDEGTGGNGTRWLVFGCVVALDANIEQVNQVVATARDTPPIRRRRQIHFSQLNHADKKGILSILRLGNWTGIVVASDTTKLAPDTWLAKPKYQYNYALRYLMERITQYAEYANEPVKIVIEHRRNFDLADFREYLYKQKANGERRIKWDYLEIEGIEIRYKAVEANLCLADALAHAAFKALERDPNWGHLENAYLELVEEKLWRFEGELLGNGLVFMPTAESSRLIAEYPWIFDLIRRT